MSALFNNIRKDFFDLCQHVLDGLFLLVGHIQTIVKCIFTALIHDCHQCWRKQPVFIHKVGACDKVFFGCVIVAAEVMPVGQAFTIEIPVPGYKLYAEASFCGSQKRTIEVCQSFIPIILIG